MLDLLTALLLLVGVYFWFPGSGEISVRGHIYEFEKRRDNTNPLYVKGCFREKKSISSLFSELKGLYISQIVSLFLIFLTVGYFCVAKSYRQIFGVEKLLIGCFGLLIFWRISLKIYYRKCYEKMFRYTEKTDRTWLPFSYIFQPFAPKWRPYRTFHCQYHDSYDDLKRSLEQRTVEKGYTFVKCFCEGDVKEFNIFTRLSEAYFDIFALIHIERLEEESWDKFNDIFEDFWKEYIAERYETKQIAFTFLICVDEYSRELRKKCNGIYGVDSEVGRYRLPAILAYSENSCLYIPMDYRLSYGEKRRKKIRKEFLEMLDLFSDYKL